MPISEAQYLEEAEDRADRKAHEDQWGGTGTMPKLDLVEAQKRRMSRKKRFNESTPEQREAEAQKHLEEIIRAARKLREVWEPWNGLGHAGEVHAKQAVASVVCAVREYEFWKGL